MTYTYKLASRLARLRTCAFAVGAALSVACTSGDGDALSPNSTNGEYSIVEALRGRQKGHLKRMVSFRVIPDTAKLEPLDTTTFAALAKLSDGTSTSIKVNWTASGGTIDSTGKFTAYSRPGTYRVIATTPTGAMGDTAAVTVSDTVVTDTSVTVTEPVAAVLVTLASGSLTVGQTTQATAKTYDASGQTLTGRTVTLSSSDNAVATVSASGLVTAVAPGAATIRATSEGQTGSADITVTAVSVNEPVASVSVTLGSASLNVGQTTQATAKTYDASGQILTGRTVTLSSSDSAVATVSASGLVKAVAAGTAAIRATSEGQTGSADITVTAVSVSEPVASVSVTLGSASLNVGQTTQATAKTYDASGQLLTGRTVTLSSSNNAVATVSASGLVTAMAAGTAAVRATSEGKTGSANVTVTALPGGPSACVGTPINPGDDWSAKVSGGGTGTVFCIKAGTHQRQSVVPKSGQKFIGEPGAIMDGDGVTAYAFSGSASNVVIKHLVIRAYAPTAGDQGMINATGSLGWVVDSNEIANSTQQGVRIGKAGHLGWNYIHHNRVVGASLFQGDRTVIEGNHFAFNPPGSVTESGATARASQMKIFRSVGVVVRNNVIEDGTRKGIWFDTDNYLAVIENNTIRRQAQACIWYEAGYDATITGNTIAGCGNGSTSSWPSDAGIQVTNSYPITITNNTVSGANNGIVGMAVGGSSNPDYTTGNRGPKALGIHASGNTVTQPQGWAAGVRTTGTGADSAFTWSGHSTWTANRYNTTGNVSAAWTWLNAGKTQAQWQGLGFDTP